jgi:hypothetical protein
MRLEHRVKHLIPDTEAFVKEMLIEGEDTPWFKVKRDKFWKIQAGETPFALWHRGFMAIFIKDFTGIMRVITIYYCKDTLLMQRLEYHELQAKKKLLHIAPKVESETAREKRLEAKRQAHRINLENRRANLQTRRDKRRIKHKEVFLTHAEIKKALDQLHAVDQSIFRSYKKPVHVQPRVLSLWKKPWARITSYSWSSIFK